MAIEKLFYNLIPTGSINQSFFINSSESWKISFLFLELRNLTFALSMKVLKGFILMLLLDRHMQVVKKWEVSSSLLKSKSFIFTLAMSVLKDFIFVLLLKTTGREKKYGKAWLLYNWYSTTWNAARSETIGIWKKLYCLIGSMHEWVLALISKVKRWRYCKKSKIRELKGISIENRRPTRSGHKLEDK